MGCILIHLSYYFHTESFDVKIIDGGINDTRIVGTVALAVMVVICAVGMEWESKAQNFLIAIIVAAILNFVLGATIGPMGNEEKIAQGFEGLSCKWTTECLRRIAMQSILIGRTSHMF